VDGGGGIAVHFTRVTQEEDPAKPLQPPVVPTDGPRI